MLIDGEIAQPRLAARVREQARELELGKLALDAVLAPFWLVGWLAFWLCVVVAETLRLGVAATRVGFGDARARAKGMPQRWPVKPRATGGSG